MPNAGRDRVRAVDLRNAQDRHRDWRREVAVILRRAARVDANQEVIVAALRQAGASVVSLHAVGKDVPDLLVGYNGSNWLIEVKNPARKSPRGKVRPSDNMHEDWHRAWRGQSATVWTELEALQTIGVLRR